MLVEYLTLCLAAALGGAINSVAGGGTLITFPALFATLGSSANAAVVANATSTVALFPGSVAALFGYGAEIRAASRWAWLLALPSMLGGLAGSLLVTLLPSKTFEFMVPWLILTAAVLFALQPKIARWFGIGLEHAPASPSSRLAVIGYQTLVAVYGGYFGAGIGILMLAALAMMGIGDIHRMNALKTFLASCINGVAVVVFIVQGKVNWPLALVMAVAAGVGGYGGARVAQRLNRQHVRRGVTVIGFVLAAVYFYRQFGPASTGQ